MLVRHFWLRQEPKVSRSCIFIKEGLKESLEEKEVPCPVETCFKTSFI